MNALDPVLLPDLNDSAVQDEALELLLELQSPKVSLREQRLLAAIHNELYELWTSPKGSPVDPRHHRFTCRNCGASWDETRERDQKHRGHCPNCGAQAQPSADFLQDILDASSPDDEAETR